MTNFKEFVIIKYPAWTFAGIVFVLGTIGLNGTPAFIPLVLIVAALHLYMRVIVRRPGTMLRSLALWLSLTLAGALANMSPAMHALSSSSTSLILMLIISGMASLVALFAVFCDARFCQKVSAGWAQITLFPIIWATVWAAVSSISPIGRLICWSPVQGLGPFSWLVHTSGPIGIDWCVGSCAVVLSQGIGGWFMGPSLDRESQDEILIAHEPPEDSRDSFQRATIPLEFHSVVGLGMFLFILMIPGFISGDWPLPPFSVDTTPLEVGCVLPTSLYAPASGKTPLDDFISASAKMTRAKVLVWPESAVSFPDADARDAALERVRKEVVGPYVGVSFEEFVPSDTGERTGIRRNGFALVGPKGPVIQFDYYKRHLVPGM